MAPSAVPIEGTTSELTLAGVAHNIQKTAASLIGGSSSPLPELDASQLTFSYTKNPKSVPAVGSPELESQTICTDHMITAEWSVRHGWAAPELRPYGPLAIMPNASVLHYATECFEGMKLYRGYDGKLRLFRPERNATRMLTSANRIALPAFHPQELEKLIAQLCATDGKKWLPKDQPGNFLYIRPTLIADDPALGVRRPEHALLYIFLSCFPIMDTKLDEDGTPRGLKLYASQEDTIRAWPGGFGYAKLGANYGPSLVAHGEAAARGYDQILWLFGDNCYVTEAGASNFFIVWKTREGNTQLVTAPLKDKIILDGVTRRSVLELARERLCSGWDRFQALEVVERKFEMSEIVSAVKEGRIVEAFVSGTAFFIAPIEMIHFRGEDLTIPTSTSENGSYAQVIKTWLKNIMYGKERHPWGVVVEEKEEA